MLDERGWSFSTRKMRLVTVKAAHVFCLDTFNRTLLRASPDHLVAFLARSKTPRTRNTYYAALRAFFRFALVKGYRKTDPTESLERVREPRYLPRPLSKRGAAAVLTRSRTVSARAWVIVSLMLYAGLRRGEVAQLTWGDVDLGTGELRVFGKGSKERIVPVSDRLGEVLAFWHVHANGANHLFPSPVHPGRPISPQTVWREVKAAGSSVPGTMPHRLRHSFATALVRDGRVDIRHVQELMGHASLASTQIYTEVVIEDLRPDVATLDFEGRPE